MEGLKKIPISTVVELVVSLILGYGSELVCGALDAKFWNPGLRLLIFSLGWFVLGLLCVAGLKRLRSSPRIDYHDTRHKICEAAQRFQTGQGEALFEFSQDNNGILAAEAAQKHRNIVYYSLSAKMYLNWIDYVYFVFLRMLRDCLECKLIIGLHFPDHIKECKNLEGDRYGDNPDADPNALAVEYADICRTFEKNARQILGEQVSFVREDQFYRRNPKKYAETFRNIYDAFVLYFARHIGRDDGEPYKTFKRRLSHMESAFPVWMLAEQYRRSRLFVLDNAVTLEIWNYQPLKDIRRKHEIYFIYSNSLMGADGRRIDVHNVNNVINLTDPANIVVEKAGRLTREECRTMLELLSADEAVFPKQRRFSRDGDPYVQLMELLQAIQSHYSFEEFRSRT